MLRGYQAQVSAQTGKDSNNMNCVVCDKPISKKARYCSDKCKQIAYRNRKQEPTVTPVTLTTVTSPTVTDLEQCRYCSEPLPPLAKPRQYPGACLSCALIAPRKCSLEAIGNTVYAGSERPIT